MFAEGLNLKFDVAVGAFAVASLSLIAVASLLADGSLVAGVVCSGVVMKVCVKYWVMSPVALLFVVVMFAFALTVELVLVAAFVRVPFLGGLFSASR